MKVELIGITYSVDLSSQLVYNMVNDDIITISAAAKQCYNKKFNYSKFYSEYDNNEKIKIENFITRIANSGHTSILEHASASFLITGVSRALTHQLVRHRIASYTQQSQRYVDMSNLEYVIPPTIKNCKDKSVLEDYKNFMKLVEQEYKNITVKLINAGLPENKVREDARFILPNATCSNIVMTMNYRELGDFLGKRMCMRAQWEIRKMATKIFDILSVQSPSIFGKNAIYRGAKCNNLEYCNESKSCGKYPSLKQLKDAFKYT